MEQGCTGQRVRKAFQANSEVGESIASRLLTTNNSCQRGLNSTRALGKEECSMISFMLQEDQWQCEICLDGRKARVSGIHKEAV